MKQWLSITCEAMCRKVLFQLYQIAIGTHRSNLESADSDEERCLQGYTETKRAERKGLRGPPSVPKNKSSTAHLVRTLFNVVECLVQWESQDTAQKHWFLPQKKQRTRGKQPSKNIYIFIIFTTFQQSLQHCFERQVPKQTTSFCFGSDYSSHFSMQPIYALKSPPRTIS